MLQFLSIFEMEIIETMKNKALSLFAIVLISCSAANGPNLTEKKNQDLSGYATAYFASGCFWCVEAIFESVAGVQEAESGYAGGHTSNPTYESIGTGKTGHAEAVKVYYDPSVVSFETLLVVFYDSHDPTTVNGQAPDFGSQYRSIAFYQNEEEKNYIESYIKRLKESKAYAAPIATEVAKLEQFYIAEDYHQDYEKLHPNNGYVRNVSIPRLNRFKAKHPELLK